MSQRDADQRFHRKQTHLHTERTYTHTHTVFLRGRGLFTLQGAAYLSVIITSAVSRSLDLLHPRKSGEFIQAEPSD